MSSNSQSSSLFDCIDADGNIDMARYKVYQNRKKKTKNALNALVTLLRYKSIVNTAKRKVTRRCKVNSISTIVYGDITIPAGPEMSPWYSTYISSPRLDNKKFHKLFRRRFRMPYKSFLILLELVKAHPLFKRWQSKDATGSPSSPIELLLLGVLRILGRAWTFDDLDDVTFISAENHRQFFHAYIQFGSTFLFEKNIRSPTNEEQAKSCMDDYKAIGFPGAVGSMDATHIGSIRIPSQQVQNHMGFKLTNPARSYNLTCNHNRRILFTTGGHPARYNDKGVYIYDEFAVDIKEGTILQNCMFELYYRDEDGNTKKQKYRGAWLITDNGYFMHPTTIPPMKTPIYRNQLFWTARIESCRKDVECTFGILKGRWMILRAPIRLHGISVIDKIWKTCCAMHNMLIDVDGIDPLWKKEGELKLDFESLVYTKGSRPLDTDPDDSSINDNFTNDDSDDDDDDGNYQDNVDEDGTTNEQSTTVDVEQDTDDNVLVVKDLAFDKFRDALVEHLSIADELKEIQWPKNMKV